MGVLGGGEAAVHIARLLRNWTADVVVLPPRLGALVGAGRRSCEGPAISIHAGVLAAILGRGREVEAVRFADGGELTRSALFAVMPQRQVSVVERLDLELTELGSVKVDGQQRTSLPGLWAAGDFTSRMQQVAEAVAQGHRAGAFILASLALG